MQLAVTDQVFLLDVCTEAFCQHSDTVGFVRSLFSSRNVLKLGEPHVRGLVGDSSSVCSSVSNIAPLVS